MILHLFGEAYFLKINIFVIFISTLKNLIMILLLIWKQKTLLISDKEIYFVLKVFVEIKSPFI